jgi:tetratricopeptide (TPR) repeat protein
LYSELMKSVASACFGVFCLLAALATDGRGLAQSAALAESTRALYRGDYTQAAQLAEKHLHSYPNDASVRVILGRADLALGKFQLAFEELRKALATDPRNIDALYYLALVARELSQQQYQKLVALAPDSDRVHQLLGEAALAAENPSQAEIEFQKALKANPHAAEVLTELAELKRSQSKFDEAIAYYNQAEETGTVNYEIAYGLGACYTYRQDYAQAVRWLRKAVDIAPESSAGRFALGNALFQGGQLEAAIPELRFALQREPRLKQAYFLLGRIYSKLGRQDDARAALKKLDELNRAEVPRQVEIQPER